MGGEALFGAPGEPVSLRLNLTNEDKVTYDIVEKGGVVRTAVSLGEMAALRASLFELCALPAPDARERPTLQKKKSASFPLLNYILLIDDHAAELKSAQEKQKADDETERAAWETWLRGAYLDCGVLQSPSFSAFFDDAEAQSSARTKRLVAEARVSAAKAEREGLRGKLKAREADMAKLLCDDQIADARESLCVASLRAQRAGLESFLGREAADVAARNERASAGEAQAARLGEEVTRAEDDLARSTVRARSAKATLDSAAAAGKRARDAAQTNLLECAAAKRGAAERAAWLDDVGGRVRARLSQRAAGREAARYECDRARDALALLVAEAVPRAAGDVADAALARTKAEEALVTHRRSARSRSSAIQAEHSRRTEEAEAIQNLTKLLEGSQTFIMQPPVVLAEAKEVVDDGTEAFSVLDFVDSGDEPPPPGPGSAARAHAELVHAYVSSAWKAERLLETTRNDDALAEADLVAQLEAARLGEAALQRVLAGSLRRLKDLDDAAMLARRDVACATAAHGAAAEAGDDVLRLDAAARRASADAEAAHDDAQRAKTAAGADTARAEGALRHALDADESVALRNGAALASFRDALAAFDLSGGADGALRLPAAETPVVQLGRRQIDLRDAEIVRHESLKAEIRSRIAERCAAWDAESVSLKAQLHGAECQIRIYTDDARAATLMQQDLQMQQDLLDEQASC
ncbi:hypothetical protein M885DRAFT_614700 [Pelagophyceae sp. CCMP2097]|nr:hypothetical protein M885DRAFT_614700 [Pelagophyceae sp. CCMP2097]